MDRESWHAAVHVVAKSWTWLSDWTELNWSQLFHSLLLVSSRGSLVLLHFLSWGWCHLHMWGYCYFSQKSWLQLISSSPAFLMMYSASKLNKQGDNIQPWQTSFPIWNQSVGPCPVLTVASWPAYRFLIRWVTWSGIPISLRIFQFAETHMQRL